VEGEYILFDDGNAIGREPHTQVLREGMIQLDGEHTAGSSRENAGDGAAAGANLRHSVTGHVTQRRDNLVGRLRVDEKVLAKLGFLRHAMVR
jgi:hypothetical protein